MIKFRISNFIFLLLLCASASLREA